MTDYHLIGDEQSPAAGQLTLIFMVIALILGLAAFMSTYEEQPVQRNGYINAPEQP